MFLLTSDFQYFLAGDDKASTTLEREFVSAQTEISRDLANDIQALESVHAALGSFHTFHISSGRMQNRTTRTCIMHSLKWFGKTTKQCP